ncbi:iron complex outermembrane receptor protein [Novosphingobium chloroacetimidivorans]|uniref:Iron complex outermembrane receptor protein n=1 Tax=Novosphingobium chloroacetimidivorans TaxID=1428314 RepID=A0A7W7K8T1_9SPHN|nr:TonB-dependent receptor [Novosphingobium chloroacetimidivorans]MBB4858357.1 iron complex outermembrane receptor protein [Novosphingobium chloroacetimidivorans]
MIDWHRRSVWFASTGLAVVLHGAPAYAQDTGGDGGLQEIVVTAQKREQSLQDVPIAVTAVTQDSLQANRIFSVNDLSSIAPGVTVKPSPGGSSVPVFTIRGQSSFGVVPGSDKQVSIYIDGVYVSSPRGSIFELPDIQRLEVLRGPQGTLFGRNATAGAISVTTRDPTGDPHIKAEASLGNRNAYRYRVTADLPQMGPFTAFGSFVRNYRRGEVRNARGGLIWDRSSSRYGVQVSPNWLGTIDSNSYFGAVKFEPSDSFKVVYKYDRNEDEGTPDVTGIVGYDPAFAGLPALVGNILRPLYASQELYVRADGKRPNVATNGFTVPRTQTVQGHSATATWQATDSLTVKNIFAYRKSSVLGPTPIDGISSLTFTQPALVPYATLVAFSSIGSPGIPNAAAAQAAIPAFARQLQPLVGQRFLLVAAQSASTSRQWSDELQVNFTTGNLNATAGALWFHSKDVAGGPDGLQNTLSFPTFVPQNGAIPLGNEGIYNNKATSVAAYAQLEYKFTPQLEAVLGARITRDKKSSTFTYNSRGPTGIVSPDMMVSPPDFKKTKPNFLVGINWTPNQDTLVYGKFSNSFVSGGSTGGIPYEPETAKSWEVGVKADFFRNKLRTNLALFHVDYNHFQQSQSTSTVASAALALPILTQLYGPVVANEILPKLSVFVGDQGKVRARGFELEVTAAPTRGLTIGGSLSYVDISFPFIEPGVLAANGGRLDVTARPEWTASAYGAYETQPLFGEATLSLRTDAFYQGKMGFAANPDLQIFDWNRGAAQVDGYWTINGRLALRHLPIGPVDAELALWGKNLTNRRDATTALFTPFSTSANYVPARTYGVDLMIEF